MVREQPLECAVLTDGRRGFILRQTMQAIGFAEKNSSNRFEAFCEKIGANALISNGDQLPPFVECDNPFGPRATWLPWELLCRALDLGNVSMAVDKLDADERGSISLTDRTSTGGDPNVYEAR